MKRSVIAAIVCFFSVGSAVAGQYIPPRQIESTSLPHTQFTPYPQAKIIPGTNLIFCVTFQLAWNELMDSLIKEPVLLQGDPASARILNRQLTGKDLISNNCFISAAGFKKDGIEEKINTLLSKRFRIEPGIDIALVNPEDILVSAFLLKELSFPIPFENINEPVRFNGSFPVQAFGINQFTFDQPHRDLSSQVRILHYVDDDNFILELVSDSVEDELILAKVPPREELFDTIESVLNAIEPYPGELFEGETLQIPKFDFNILHNFSDLTGRRFLNKDFNDYSITKAVQSVRFKLNEKGVLLRSESAVEMTLGIKNEKRPRKFIFDKPFLVCLKEKNKKFPYLVFWIGNEELLLK